MGAKRGKKYCDKFYSNLIYEWFYILARVGATGLMDLNLVH